MKHELTGVVPKYRSRGILVDTDILLMFFVGIFNPKQIESFKRTQSYSTSDFQALVAFLNVFEKIVTTPNILTEVSNHGGQLPSHLVISFREAFSRAIGTFIEIATPSREIAGHQMFGGFGLTDGSTAMTAKDKFLVLTNDSKLVGALHEQGVDVIDFNFVKAWLNAS